MISIFISRVMMLTAGTLYPAYRSYKAVRTKDVKEYVKWMMYWIVFALITCAESLADILLAFWFPFYYELKIIFVLWLISPWTKGASLMYRNWVHPWLLKHERDIDFYLEQAKAEGYNQVLSIGQRGMMFAKDIVATAAIRGQEQISQQLQRSYSMGDVSTRRTTAGRRQRQIEQQEDWIEEIPEERHMGDTSHSWAGNIQQATRPRQSTSVADVSDHETEESEEERAEERRSRRGSRSRRTVD